jgi:imidazolonepropionase-like amidohydrolase
MTGPPLCLSGICLLKMLLLAGQADAQPSRGALTSGTIAVTNVSVVTMTSPAVLADMTVVIQDGRVIFVSPASISRVPTGARKINGTRKYLIPGLADMHLHLFSDDNVEVKDAGPEELGVMLANGVTTIRLMIGTPEHLRMRKEIESGKLLGPQMWIASPQFTGKKDSNARVVLTPEEARKAVNECAGSGYDFIKLTLDITPEVFDAIVQEAAKDGIRVVGHVDPRVGVARALAAGQHIEHLDNYMESVLKDDSPIKTSVSDFGVFRLKNWESIDFVDDRKVAQIAQSTARSRTWTCPTLTLFKQAFAIHRTAEEIKSQPDWALQPKAHRDIYWGAHQRYWKNPPDEAHRKKYIEVRNRMVKSIFDAGGKILAGSDAPEWFLEYGFTLHRELQSLVEAGLSPYQALCAATRNPADFLHASREWGTIEKGKRADLVLLSANPLEDIRNTTKIEGMCVGGKWLVKTELQRLIKKAVVKLSGAPSN